MPIVVAPMGVDLKIVKILTDKKTKKHLENLGLTINSTINIISCSGSSVICIVQNGRLAFDKDIATKIFVA
ncbi:MAG: ferrous iron transport protein A [Clostridia bacterium]